MGHRLALDYFTAAEAGPERLARIAAANDCALFSLHLTGGGRVDAQSQALVDEAATRRAYKATCEALGVRLEMVEGLIISPETDLELFRPALEAAAFLGAWHANTLFLPDPDRDRAKARFVQLCAIAADYGLEILLEVSRRMLTRRPADAAALLRETGAPNARMLIDTLHLFRFDGTAADVAAVAGHVGRLQLCDGPRQSPTDQLEEAMNARLPPGEGDFPLAQVLAATPQDIVVGLEVPMEALRRAGVSAEDRAARIFAATRRLLDEA